MNLLTAVLAGLGLAYLLFTAARTAFDRAARPDVDVPPGLEPLRTWIT